MRRLVALLAVTLGLVVLTVAWPATLVGAATSTTIGRKGSTTTTATVPVTSPASTAAAAPSLVTSPTLAPVSATTLAPADVTKKSARTTVDTLIVILLVLAVVVVSVSVWYWRVTKPLPRQLEPLATMSTRSWRRAPAERRSVALERVRPRRADVDPLLAESATSAVADASVGEPSVPTTNGVRRSPPEVVPTGDVPGENAGHPAPS